MVLANKVEDLEVFRRAYAVSLEIHKMSLSMPAIEQKALADQLRRASKSICANLAEGFGKQACSKPEFRRFIAMAIGSSDEMQIWLKYAVDLGYISRKTGGEWWKEYRQISMMLQGLIRKGKELSSDH
jgi:four helix bundle protein